MHKIILLVFLLLLPRASASQFPVLERYVQEGLANNLALKQQDFSYQQSLEALQEAKGMFMPSINFEARYSRAGGGREIIIPIGDLMNPVYGTLNDLLIGQGEPPRPFPHLENEVIPFLREEEQETKLRLIQPIFQPQIYYNYKIRSNLSRSQEAVRNAYQRSLVAEIKKAYFNYLRTLRVVDLLDDTRRLVEENLRVSEALFEANMATRDVVYRSKAEISQIEQNQAKADRDKKLAASYFNFLLNRPRNNAIELPEEELAVIEYDVDYDAGLANALQKREELAQLGSAIEAAANNVKLEGSTFLPSVNLVFDYGIWGENYNFPQEDDFWMGSIMFEWNLFNGFQKKARRDKALLERRELETGFEELEQQIELQVQEAYENLLVAWKAIDYARDGATSARKSFAIIRSKYKEGFAPLIEYIDARTTMTRAEIDQILALYAYHIRYAEYERVAALLEI